MRKLFLLVVMAFSAFTMQAQDFNFGVKLGGNFNKMTISGDDAEYSQYLKGALGFQIGALGEYSFNEQFSILGEINFITINDKIYYETEAYGISVINDVKAYSSYIEIPIMAKYYINESISIEAGPQIGFLQSGTYKGTYTINGEEDIREGDTELSCNATGFNIGASYKLENGLFFNARYVIGLNDIDKEEGSITKNNTFQISIGYFFNGSMF